MPATGVIDTISQRDSERLTVFLTKILTDKPIDQHFQDRPFLREVWKNRETDSYGRQVRIDLSTDESPNFQWFSLGTTFGTALPNVARPAVFGMVNAGDTINIDYVESMEASTDDVRAFNLVNHRRELTAETIRKNLNTALLSSGNSDDKPIGLPNLVDTTSTVGGIDRSSNSFYQATVRSSVGAFASNGLSEMRSGYNLAIQEVGDGMMAPNFGVTTRSIHESFEAVLDPDVVYSDSSELSRGAKRLMWKGFPLVFDGQVATGEMYFLNFNNYKLHVEERAALKATPFREQIAGTTTTSKVLLRVCTTVKRPNGLVKLEGIT